MMPVVKNDYNIYKSGRSRRSSECSNPQSCRSRKVSECSKSEGPSLSTSPGSDFVVGSPHRSTPLAISNRYSRNSSRNSQSSLQSPTKSTSSSPPKSASTSSLNKFHTRVVDKLKRSLRLKDSRDSSDSTRRTSWEAAPTDGEEELLVQRKTATPVLVPQRHRTETPRVASSYPGTSTFWSRWWCCQAMHNTCGSVCSRTLSSSISTVILLQTSFLFKLCYLIIDFL